MNVYSQSLNAFKGIRSLALSLGTSSKSTTAPAAGTFNLNDLPSKPKRPPTPWNRFMTQNKGSVKGMKTSEVTKSLSVKWASLDPSNKAPFVDAYNREKVVYDHLKKEYDNVMKQTVTVQEMVKLMGENKVKKEKPKNPRAKTGYNLFMTDVMAKDRPLLSNGKPDLSAVAKSWRALSDSQREAYNRRAHELSAEQGKP